jgi:hypothetical protein
MTLDNRPPRDREPKRKAEKCTPKSPKHARRVREEASRRFEDASRAYYLLVHSACSPQRLEQAAAAMDRWAARLA